MSKQFKEYTLIIIGALLFSVGLNIFIVPVGLYNGGAVGIAQIIRTLLNLNTPFDIAGIINLIINIPLLILAYLKFGRSLFLKTIISVISQTVFLSLITIPSTPIILDYLTACIIGGMIAGWGVGITLKAGGTSGGNDILGLYFSQKCKNFSVGKLTIIVNAGIYLVCAFLFELPTAIYSIIYSTVCSLTIDRVHIQNINMNVQIFTKNPELHDYILKKLHRGVTFWKGVGAYTQSDTYVLITVISKYEITQLKEIINEKDPNAFVIMSEGPEILGNYEKRL